ncbi:hypothetical protein HGRIS_005790 [Hohenbuehelia grisea]|uniref:F-box domain-containing protein n=1 Tax=Hohenbuehelia grisea TaxID=104357 RepID=A0ABR3JXW7_9AGAR
MHNMVHVPNEIWYLIAEYLQDEDVKRLRGLNRVFFELAMSLRYHRLDFEGAPWVPFMISPLIQHIKSRYVARHVHDLYIDPNHIAYLVALQEQFDALTSHRGLRGKLGRIKAHSQYLIMQKLPKYLQSRLIGRSLPWTIEKTRGYAKVSRELDEVLPSLYNLRRCVVGWLTEAVQPSPHKMSFRWPMTLGVLRDLRIVNPPSYIHKLWFAIGPTLEELHLCITPTRLPHILGTAPYLFNRLRKFSLMMFKYSNGQFQPHDQGSLSSSAASSYLSIIYRFINCNRASLLSLVIQDWPHLNLATLFSHLEHIPYLQELRLHIPFDRHHLADAASLARFLADHSNTLSSLALHYVQCSAFCSIPLAGLDMHDEQLEQILGHTEFPSLCSLDLSLMGVTEISQMLRQIQHLCHPRLESLELATYCMDIHELQLLCSSFAGMPDPPLRRLYIYILNLRKAELDLLARSFPSLDSLHLLSIVVNEDFPAVRDAFPVRVGSITHRELVAV